MMHVSVALRHLVVCLDSYRVPLNREQRQDLPGDVPYWGSGGIAGHISKAMFDEGLVLLGEDGAPFFDPTRDVAFCVSGPVWINNHIHVLRPRSDVDPRFLTYSLNSVDYARYITGSTRDKLTQDDMREIQVAIPPLEVQRRVADFLDDQVALIDHAIQLRQRQTRLLDQRRWSTFLAELVGVPRRPLRRVIAFATDGPFGSAFTSSDYTEVGPAVVRLGNIGFARFKAGEIARIPEEVWTRFPRCHVREGDLLVASLGDPKNHAGRACIAPNLGPAMVKGKCFCVRVKPNQACADFVALLLSSPLGADQLAVETRGATRGMINLEILRAVSLPLPSLDVQIAIAARTRAEWALLDKVLASQSTVLELLQERKQSLITAAVTGEFNVSTASVRGVA